MAGLQYNFFPTDFFYPRPPLAAADAASKSVAPIQILRRRDVADDLDHHQRQSKSSSSTVQINDINLRINNNYPKQQPNLKNGSANSPPFLIWFPEQSSDSS